MYVEGFGFPFLLTFLLRFLGAANLAHIQMICLYGYSMTPCIICLLFCSFNVCILHIALLAYGLGSKAACIMKNIGQGIEIPSSKKLLVIGVVLAEAALQFFVFKLTYIRCGEAPLSTSTNTHHSLEYFHARKYAV